MKMRDYIIRRLILLIPVVVGVAIITFILSRIVPADPARAWAGGARARPETVELIRETYHLNDPIPVQFYYYVKDLLRFDFGVSPVTHMNVIDDIKTYIAATFELGIVALIIAIAVGIPLGIISAVKKDQIMDHFTRIFALSGVSVPIFWLGLMMQYVFYYKLKWFPDAGGRVNDFVALGYPLQKITGFYILDSLITGNWVFFKSSVIHIVMPSVALGYASTALITRMTRSSMLEVLRQDYVRTARSKGLSERVVIYKHALRNAMIPVVTILGLAFGGLIAGAVLTETVFYWPGMGRRSVQALTTMDFPFLMGFVMLVAILFVLANLLVDLLYAVIDPRIRYG